jgi:hypothetical protein
MKFFSLLCVLCIFCGAGNSATAQAQPPVNVIITLTGENFLPQSSVFVGSAQFTPEFVSPNVLRVSIPRAMLSSVQPNNVRVVNPVLPVSGSGGGSSAGLPLVVACETVNAVALEFAYTTKQLSFHTLDSARNTVSLSETDIAFNAVRVVPMVKRTRVSGTINNDGTHITTYTDETVASEQPVYTDMARDAENLRQTKSTVVDHRQDTATVTMYDASGAVIQRIPYQKKSLRELVNSLRANPSPCPNPSALRVGAAQALPAFVGPGAPSSMRQLVQSAQDSGFTVEQQGTGSRYKIILPHNPNTLGLRFNTEATRIEAYIDTDPAKNVVESIHGFNGSRLVHSTYYVPRTLGNCAPDYKTIVHVSYYTTPTGVAMKFISQTDIQQMTMNNFIR